MSEAKCPQGGARCREDAALPAGWRRVRLGEIGTFSKGSGISRAESKTGDLPAVRYGEIYTHHNDYVSNYISRISADVASRAKLTQRGDVLFAGSGETEEDIGKSVAILEDGVFAGGDLIVFTPSEETDPMFMGMLMNQPYVQRQKTLCAQGGTVVHIRAESIAKIEISLPPLPEQRAIAGVLGRVDQLVDSLAKRIAKKKAIKQGVMADLLTGRRRVQSAECGVQSAEFSLASRVSHPDDQPNLRDSVAPCENCGGVGVGDGSHMRRRAKHGGEVAEGNGEAARKGPRGTETRREEDDAALPAGWRMTTIRESTTVKARIGWQGLTTAEYLKDGPHYLVTGVDIENGRVTWDTCFFVNDSRYQQDKHIQLRAGDVLVSKDGTIGKVAFVEILPRSATLNSGVFVIRSATVDLDQEYLARVFLSDWFDGFIKKITAGSTIAHLYQKDIVNFAFPIPPLPEQRAIAGVLWAMDAEIAKLEAKKAKIERLKQGLMSDLLSGRVRVLGDGK